MRLRLQPEFEDLAVERAAADFEDAGRFFLVPAARIEDAHDVRPLGLAQRRQPLAVVFGRRLGRVEKFDVGGANRSARAPTSAARETVLSSSRMLPGQ